MRRRDLDDIAGAEIVDRGDGAERVTGGIDGGEADQVGMVILTLAGGRQYFARDIEFDAIQAFGVLAGRDASQRRDQMALRLAGMRDLELARAVLGGKSSVAVNGKRVFGEGPQLHGATHAVRGADASDADRCRHRRVPPSLTSWRRLRRRACAPFGAGPLP